MRIEKINTATTLYETRYSIQFDSEVVEKEARKRFRMPVHGDGFLLSALDALDAFNLASNNPGGIWDDVIAMRHCARGLLEKRESAAPHTPYPFQKNGAAFLTTSRDAYLGDEMGLGKTMQALLALPDKAHGVIVAPKSLVHTWAKEGELWRPDLEFIVSDRQGLRGVSPGEFLITTPDAVRIHNESSRITYRASMPSPRSVLILDEAHYYKSKDAARTGAIRRLATHFDMRWILTGTPLANKPPDLWNTLASIGLERRMFADWREFTRIFGGTKDHMGAWRWAPEPVHPRDLAAAFRGCSLRRLRKVVAPEIPEKTYVVVPAGQGPGCDAGDRRSIQDAAARVGDDIRTAFLPESLGAISKLRAEVAESKIGHMEDFVRRFVDEGTPLVVVSANSAPLEALRHTFDCPIIDGHASAQARAQSVEDFQAGTTQLIGLNPVAGGVGITLTAAHHLLFVQRDWSLAVNDQVEDRICRIGQRNTCVIYDLVSDHPLDSILFQVLRRKTTLTKATTAAIPSA